MKQLKNYFLIYVITFLLACNFVYAQEIVITENISTVEGVERVERVENVEETVEKLEVSNPENGLNVSKETENKVSIDTGDANGNGGEKEKSEDKEKQEEKVEESKNEVKDIDLGEYKKQMIVGERQLIMATVLPSSLDIKEFSFLSSNGNVASVNMMGRISAINPGIATITVTAEGYSKGFAIEVTEPEKEKKIRVKSIDLGQIQEKMTVGETQLISPIIIPDNATEREITFSSSKEKIATISDIGRIKALKAGTTTIKVRADREVETFLLEVKDPIRVTDIEVGDFNEKMKVKGTQKLSVSIIPEDAVNKKTTYTSDDVNVATISPTGNIKAIGKGNTKIRIVADDYEKVLDLKVSFTTEKISVNETYIILKPNETFELKAKAFPGKAEQKITFKSTNPEVVSVSTEGVLKSEKIGRSSVVVTNGDLQKIVFVIVNDTNEPNHNIKGNYYKRNFIEEEIKNIALDTETNEIELDGTLYPTISKNMLKEIVNTRKDLCIDYEKYGVQILGNKVKNIDNQFNTNIEFSKGAKGIEFILNNYNKLPGEIEITLPKEYFKYKYIYLYNENKGEFEMIEDKIGDNTVTARIAGKYLLTEKKLSTFVINKTYLVIGSSLIIILVAIYVFVKKRHWFW